MMDIGWAGTGYVANDKDPKCLVFFFVLCWWGWLWMFFGLLMKMEAIMPKLRLTVVLLLTAMVKCLVIWF